MLPYILVGGTSGCSVDMVAYSTMTQSGLLQFSQDQAVPGRYKGAFLQNFN